VRGSDDRFSYLVAGPVTALPGRARRGGPACPPRRGQPRRVAPTKKLPGSHAAPPAPAPQGNSVRPFLCSRRILMGAFNELKADALCPRCGKLATFIVQFKYGNTRQFQYHIGESLKWGGNDIGRKEAKRVVVEGIGGPCPNCGVEFIDFNILVEENRIVTFRPIGTKRVSSSPEGFIVLDE